MGGKWLSTKMLLLLTVLLHTSFAFCPDGCACDEDLLHVTCLRSKLEVNFAFFTLEKCFDLSLKRVWWLLFHSTCKKQSALGEQDKISHLENLFLLSKGSICWSKYYTKILEHVDLNPGSRHIAHSGTQTLQFKIYWWQHINRALQFFCNWWIIKNYSEIKTRGTNSWWFHSMLTLKAGNSWISVWNYIKTKQYWPSLTSDQWPPDFNVKSRRQNSRWYLPRV